MNSVGNYVSTSNNEGNFPLKRTEENSVSATADTFASKLVVRQTEERSLGKI